MIKFYFLISLGIFVLGAFPLFAQDENTNPAKTSAPDRAVVLMGEIPIFTTWEKNTTTPEYLRLAQNTFPQDLVVDMLRENLLAQGLPDLPTTVTQVPQLTIIVLMGRSDSTSNTVGAKVQSELAAKLRSYAGTNRRVFLLPSDSQLPISQTGNLRMAASEGGATYVTLAGSAPLAEAFQEIGNAGPTDSAVMPVALKGSETSQTVAIPDGLSTSVVIDQLDPISIPDGMQEAAPTRPTPASGATEVSRIAGVSDEEKRALETSSTEMLDSLPPINAPQAISPDGKLIKRGTDARETINMKPIPAVKAYRPARPVQRKNVNKKEPDLAR